MIQLISNHYEFTLVIKGNGDHQLCVLRDTGFSHILLGQMSESKEVSGLYWHILV